MDAVRLVIDDAMALHDPGPGHPERPARLRAVQDMLDELNVPGVNRATPRPADVNAIRRVHGPAYIRQIEALRGRSARLDADTAVSPGSVDAAHLAAGAAIDAVDALMIGEARTAFALVRPPGHHAERDRAMGFCLYNNIAIAAEHAIAVHGCKRVLIVDWDVHHGNGTQHIFEDRSDVLYFSSHQWPLYPGTGAVHEVGIGAGKGFTVNAPLPAGMDDAVYITLYQRVLVPIAHAYRPDLVLVSAGFDAHRDDPLAGMLMTEVGFASLCEIVKDIGEQTAGGKLALILEGGYNLNALASGVEVCAGIASVPAIAQISADVTAVIQPLIAIQRAFWPVGEGL